MRSLILLLGLILLPAATAEEIPDYLRQALSRLGCEPPAGWSCTLTTTRDGRVSVERYDPSKPAEQQWILLQTNGHTPTPEESDRYGRYRVTTNSTQSHPVFRHGDIDPGTARLIHDAPGESEYGFRFREGLSDTLLAHLELLLTVNKSTGLATQSVLRLLDPYSPVVGLKIDRLEVTSMLSVPAGGVPQVPCEVQSRFHARFLYFKSIEENLTVRYSDFAPAGPATTAPIP